MTETSIILPTFNRRDSLTRALDSVAAQTYTDWELLVVDDGSSDDTVNMVLGRDDPRIRYITQVSAGESAARNTGLDLARGDYITFLDSDDEWLPNFLALCVGFLKHSKDEQFVTTYSGDGFRYQVPRDADRYFGVNLRANF